MSTNPYQSTQVVADTIDTAGSGRTLERSVSMLRQTKPWVRFISVLMFISCVFLFIGGIVSYGANSGTNSFDVIMVFFYVAGAIVSVIPPVFLWKYANRISGFVQAPSESTLASALEAQKSFWKFVGISVLVIMVAYGIVIAVVIPYAMTHDVGS